MLSIFLWVFSLSVLLTTQTFGASPVDDDSYMEAIGVACRQEKPADGQQKWILDELKNLGETALIEASKKMDWTSELLQFKIDEVDSQAKWIRGSPGTFGTIQGQQLKFANDKTGKILQGPVVDVGRGTIQELKIISQASSQAMGQMLNAFWLVEQSSLIPDIAALGIEGKTRGALGLIVYQNKTHRVPSLELENDLDQNSLPMISISTSLAAELRKKIKLKPVQIALSIKTEFPVVQTANDIYLKYGARDIHLLIPVNINDCDDVSLALGAIDWMKKSDVHLAGSSFDFLTGQPAADTSYSVGMEKHFIPFAHGQKGGDFKKFIKDWVKSDQEPEALLKMTDIFKRAEAISSHLHGEIDDWLLKKYSDMLKSAEHTRRDGKLSVNFRMQQIFNPLFKRADSDAISDLAERVKVLKDAHELAQKGQWDQAVRHVYSLKEFKWADEVSESTFTEYAKQRFGANDLYVNPSLLTEFQKGKTNLDGVLGVLEKEIDRLNGRLTDTFSKLQKSLTETQKI